MDHGAIVRDYAALRSVSVRLNNRLTERLSGEEIEAAAEALGMRRGKNIKFETEDEMCVLMDYAIHTVRRDGRNAVDRLLADDPPPEGSDELVLLRSLKASRYSVFEIHGPIPGVGVTGFEGPARTPMLLVDIGFSRTARRGYAVATRLHCPRGEWWMTTGAARPLNDRALGRIIRETEEHQRRFGSEPSGHVRSTMIIRACIASGASRRINYAPPGRDPAPRGRPGTPSLVAGWPQRGVPLRERQEIQEVLRDVTPSRRVP